MIMHNQDWLKIMSLLNSLEQPTGGTGEGLKNDLVVVHGLKTAKTQVLSFDPQLLQPKKTKSHTRSKDEQNTIGKFCRIFDELRQSSIPMHKTLGHDDEAEIHDHDGSSSSSESIYEPKIVSAKVHYLEAGHRLVKFNMENYRQKLTDLKDNFELIGMQKQKLAIEVLLHFLDDPTTIYMPFGTDYPASSKNPGFAPTNHDGKNIVDGKPLAQRLALNPQILDEQEKSMDVEMKFWKDIFESIDYQQHKGVEYSAAIPKITPDLDLTSVREHPQKKSRRQQNGSIEKLAFEKQKSNRQQKKIIRRKIAIGLLSGPPMIKL